MQSPGGASAPGRLGVGIVGAGRVGAVLGNALRAVGHAVVGASGTSPETLERIHAMLPGVPVLEVPDVVARAEVVLLTVPDDGLPDLVRGLATLRVWRPGQIVVHTAGRFGVSVLEPATAAGAIPVAMHPAMTFTGTSLDLARLVECPFAVTAPAPVLPIAQALVLEIGGEPIVLSEEARGLYHAAVCHGANHLVTLVAQAERVLGAVGIEHPERLLGPVLTAALDGALRGGEAGLTGPVVRGDAGTVAEHLRAIGALVARDEQLVDVPPVYLALARATVQRSLTLGRLTEAQAQALLDVLAPPPSPSNAGLLGESGPISRTTPRSAEMEMAAGMVVASTRADLAAALDALPGRRAVVMTMGALHEGHLELVRQARAHADHVIVTIFVNPLQFGAGEDLSSYPRNLVRDQDLLERLETDLVFAPDASAMYPSDASTFVEETRLSADLCGAARPGHFRGVCTVVLKLFHIVQPQRAYFGEKDFQQLQVIRRMVRDLDVPVEVVGCPLVREADGLALSSRNVYLSPEDRLRARALSRSLAHARDLVARGERDARALQREVEAFLRRDPALELDYVAVKKADTLEDAGFLEGRILVALAARVGKTRLIDNSVLEV